MVGHNIGGLFIRYAVGALYANDLFPKLLRPVNFITLGTPHLGSGGTFLSADVASILCGETGEQLALTDGEKEGEEPMLMKMCHRQFLQALLYFPNRMVYTVVTDDGRVDVCSGSIRNDNIYREASLDFLKSRGPIIEEGAEKEEEEGGFIGGQEVEKKETKNDNNFLIGGITGGIEKYKHDMCSALSEVGWRRRDVVGYGHDQMLQDPAWWLENVGGKGGKNVVLENVVKEFLYEREEGERVEGGGSSSGSLEMHGKTRLYYFRE